MSGDAAIAYCEGGTERPPSEPIDPGLLIAKKCLVAGQTPAISVKTG
jgi:hypothetical protein